MKLYLAGCGIESGMFTDWWELRYANPNLLFSFFDLSDRRKIKFRKLSWRVLKMKIYLASGFTVMNDKEREKELFEKFGRWYRLMSFYFMKDWRENILELVKDYYDES